MNECKVIRKQTYDKDLHSVILDIIPRLTSICFHDGPNSTRNPSTTL